MLMLFHFIVATESLIFEPTGGESFLIKAFSFRFKRLHGYHPDHSALHIRTASSTAAWMFLLETASPMR
jgi:hypothetical protein